jgi:hypothetical protein
MPNAARVVRDALRICQSGLDLMKAKVFENCMAAVKSRPRFFKPYLD